MPSVFDGYPFSNTHQLNLDWIIAQIKQVQPSLEELKTILENLKDINAVVEEAENASVKASAAAESAEEATERINSATVNGVPVVNNPVLTASDVDAVPDSATVNGTPVVNNPVLNASNVGAVPDSATVNGTPVVNNPVLTASDVGAVPDSATVNGVPVVNNPVLTASDVDAAPALESTEYSGCYYRTVDGTTEWINPPMLPDVEYRTTERYNGKVVYRKLVSYTHDGQMGDSSSNTDFEIPHGISNIAQAVRCITVANSDAIFPYVGSTGGILQTVSFNSEFIRVRAYKTYFNSPKLSFDLAYIKD